MRDRLLDPGCSQCVSDSGLVAFDGVDTVVAYVVDEFLFQVPTRVPDGSSINGSAFELASGARRVSVQ